MKTLIFLLCSLFAGSATAGLPVYLESSNGIGDGMKECHYSDESVVTLKSDEECPPSNGSDPEETSNQVPDIDDDQNADDD
jgi:hypothetical protein